MTELTIIREKNYLIIFRALKVYIDGHFIDYIEPNEKTKKILVEENSSKLVVKIGWCFSNEIDLKNSYYKKKRKFRVTSQIQNGLFVFIYGCFFSAFILWFLGFINEYMGMAMISPMVFIVYWETLGRKSYLRMSHYS